MRFSLKKKIMVKYCRMAQYLRPLRVLLLLTGSITPDILSATLPPTVMFIHSGWYKAYYI